MIKRITAVFSLMTVLAVSAFAQMSESVIMSYVNEALNSGKSQTEIARELSQKGVTLDQFERMRTNNAAVERSRGTALAQIGAELQVVTDTLAVSEENVRQVFGRNIFTNRNLSFAPNANMPTPENYRLGAGDEVIIDIWGTNEATIREVISPDGFIKIPNIGIVSLSGMTVKEADSYLRKKINEIYPVDGDDAGSELKLTLGSIRTIQVNVLGEVAAPGTYSVSSLSNIYNALYLAGGVTEVGSLREISLVRNNRKIASVDLYDFIFNGRSADDIGLQDGDVITVPTYKNLVDIAGKVKRPMLYEMTDDENVATLLEYSGGFMGDAYKSNIRLIRRNGVEYQVYTVDAEEFGEFRVMDGDSLTVEQIIDRYENRVDIQGSVYRPGSYQLSDRISTVSQLVRKAEGLKGDAFTNRALLYREREDLSTEVISVDLKSLLNGTAPEIVLQKNDSLYVSSIHDLNDIGTITIEGEVTSPGTFVFVDNMSIEDLIIQAGGLLESASTVRIDVNRRIKNQKSTEQPDSIGQVFTLTLNEDFVVDGVKDFLLEPYDRVSVRRSPGYLEQIAVTVSGEVIFPGSYVLTHKTERLSDLIRKAGGLNNWAYVRGASLQRKMNEDEKRRMDATLDLLDSARDSIDVEKLDITNSYYVGIDLAAALKNPGTDADLVLREGDQLLVPEYVNTVKISGNVMYPNTVTYDPDFLVKDYVEMAGGYGYKSKKSKAYIIYMNGTIKRARKLSKGVIEPGCEIVIPQKRQRDTDVTELLSIATTSSSVATMLATMGNLVSSMIK